MIHRVNEEGLLEDERLIDLQDQLGLAEQAGLEIPDDEIYEEYWEREQDINIEYNEIEDTSS